MITCLYKLILLNTQMMPAAQPQVAVVSQQQQYPQQYPAAPHVYQSMYCRLLLCCKLQ